MIDQRHTLPNHSEANKSDLLESDWSDRPGQQRERARNGKLQLQKANYTGQSRPVTAQTVAPLHALA